MSNKKTPKPFLKKGTREFLSNATVRTLTQKNTVVEFTDLNDDEPATSSTNAVTFGRQQPEVKISVKRNLSKQPVSKITEQVRTKENKPFNLPKTDKSAGSAGKKKPAGLEDYLGIGEQKKTEPRTSFSREKSTSVIKNATPARTMAAMLTKQEEQEDSDEEQDFMTENPIENRPSKGSAYQEHSTVHQVNRPPQQAGFVASKRERVEEDRIAEELCFNSDSDESDEELPKNRQNSTQFNKTKVNAGSFKPKNITPNNNNKWQQQASEEDGQSQQTAEASSKVFSKFYQKQTPKQSLQKPPQITKMTLADIPRELKDQLINQWVIEKKSEIQNKMHELQQLQIKRRQEKERYEDLNKVLTKERDEMQKEIEGKWKEHEEKTKADYDKIGREKKYLKGHQDNAKSDWKLKNEVEELRQKLVKVEKEKKEGKVKLQNEIERLQTKLQEVNQEKEGLKEAIKFQEREKLEAKAVSKAVEKKVEPVRQINYWEGAPTRSYIYKFAEPTFTLLDLDMSFFSYEQLEHYQYYLSKQTSEQLQGQDTSSEDKIIRHYKSGKQQIEFIGKVLKQVFPPPFKFTVINHINGDIKLIFGDGMQVYHDVRSQVTQFMISPEKIINNFHRQGQIELKYRHRHMGEIRQTRIGDILYRSSRKGEEKFQKLPNGAIQQIY